MASHVPCKSLLSVARRILLAFLRHVAFMSLRCNKMVSSNVIEVCNGKGKRKKYFSITLRNNMGIFPRLRVG